MHSALENRIVELLRLDPALDVVWLYGSRAVGSDSEESDVDLAVAFRLDSAVVTSAPLLDDLQHELSVGLQLPVSVVDINRVPIPLAKNIEAQGKILLCRSDFRLRAEEQRIWSLWEEYKFAHEHNRQAL